MLLLIECLLVVLMFALAFVFPRLGDRWFAPFEHWFARLARRRHLSVLVVGAATLGIRLVLLPALPVPDPAVHDEFSYLLAADTFSHGRVSNPTHPMWIHFETFHENQKPTYVSMYYPAQGLFLALGQLAFGHPFWGVWLSSGLMCAAICWMLQGWLPPLWALFGGLLAVIRLGTFSYWMNSYWGGSVAALGGALVLGALPRIKRDQRVRDTLLMSIGFAIVANSRPYEGIFLFIPVITGLLLLMFRSKATSQVYLRRIVLPLGLLLCATGGAMAWYFFRTTGSPFRTPFQVNVATYNPVPYFPWQTLKAVPAYHHPVMQKFYLQWWMQQYELGHLHPVVLLLLKSCVFWLFFIGPIFTLLLFALCFVLPYGVSFRWLSRRTLFLLLVCGSVLLGSLLPVYFNPHYAAPITCAIYALLLTAMQNVRRWKIRGNPVGIAIIRFVPTVALLMLALCALAPKIRASRVPTLATWYSPVIVNSYRAGVVSQLTKEPGLHLVLVRYSPDHAPITEWVFNDADINHSKIVWARDIGAERNQELLGYFQDRKVWLIEPDRLPPKLCKYTVAVSALRTTTGNHK